MVYRCLIVCMGICACFFNRLHAQDILWKVGTQGVFDNREYFNDYVDDQTIFGSRIYGYAGFAIDSNNRFAAGTNYFYEFGSKEESLKPDLILFYQGRLNNFSLTLGAFPFDRQVMPLSLLHDTASYYRPVIEGMIVGYTGEFFRQNVWIDWTSRQSVRKREIFVIGLSGLFSRGIFLWQHHFIMSHVAHSKAHLPGENIRDNGGFSAMGGIDLAHLLPVDSLEILTGILGSYDRIRGEYDFNWPFGWMSEVNLTYRGFGIHGVYYRGDSQEVITGDRFYRAGSYGRSDFYYTGKKPGISGKLQFSLHFIPGTVDLSMSLVIHASLDGGISLLTDSK